MTRWEVIFETIGMLLDGLKNFMNLIPSAVTYLLQVIALMPVELASFMVCVVTASIVLLLLGRG